MNIEITDETIEKMAEAFCRWEVPRSVVPDDCVVDQNYPRVGTNFFTVEEMKQAIKFMFDSVKEQMKEVEKDLGITKETKFSNVLKTLEMPPAPLTYEECVYNNQPTDTHIVKQLKWL